MSLLTLGMGALIVEKMEEFLNIINIYAENHEYWETRDLSEIPYHMRKRIGNLTHCELLEAERDCLFEFHPIFVDNLINSKHVIFVLNLISENLNHCLM